MASITIRNLDARIKRKLRDEPAPAASLADTTRERFRPLGGLNLRVPAHQPMREPPLVSSRRACWASATLLPLALTLLAPAPAHAAIPKQERKALLALYKSTNGRNWTKNDGWLGAAGTECTWHGVTCDEGKNHVVELVFDHVRGNNLTGAIPRQIGLLTDIQVLGVRFNKLRGKIPAQIWNLRNLGGLDLAGNQLTGTIPSEISNLTHLWSLDLSYNRLEGTIPPHVGSLTDGASMQPLGGSCVQRLSLLAVLSKLTQYIE